MRRLPKVLMADCIRSASEGGSHGGAYLVDLEEGTWQKVLDWNDPTIDWEGRGSKRGLRGIAFHGDDILIAASDEVFAFDREFRIRRSFRNRYLGYCHEVFLDNDTLYVTSTLYDSILALDLRSGTFMRAWMFRATFNKDSGTGPAPGPVRPKVIAYNPGRDGGPESGDSVHLNSVWVEQGRMFFSGLRPPFMLCLDDTGAVRKYADIPTWTHNARPFRGGVLCNSTGKDSICFLDLQGNVLKDFPVVRYDEARLTNVPEGTDVARQAFGRGLIATDDGLIIGSASPSTISVYDFESGSLLKSVNITMDVRNAPHGLALWPY